MTTHPPHTTPASKALRLAQYLKEFVGLRTTTVRDVSNYEAVLWFGEMPQEAECQSPAWRDEFAPDDPWLVVRKQQFSKSPTPPEIILPWIDPEALKRATSEIPQLRQSRLVPDANAPVIDGEDPPLIEQHLDDHPEVTQAYERFRPTWEAWAKEYRRRERIQLIYAELFRLHTQVRKQGELVELVLGLGLLAWRSPAKEKSIPMLRHVFTARVDVHFEPATGLIRVECAADGANLCIEDDMLEAELRPERSHYAAVNEQLKNINDDVWDRSQIFTALKSWAGALHPDSEWSPDLKPLSGGDSRPTVSFAPALILRKRTQVGMVRIYDAIIDHLNDESEVVPAGWCGLIDDDGDDIIAEPPIVPNEEKPWSKPQHQETYFPLATNREQRRIAEAIKQRRGVLVQGPPGTGKSHTIANLISHLLATGRRVLVTAETGRALQVLKEKLPEQIRPLCVSLLGQGGDAFAELNASVQGITTRYAAWTPGLYDQRIADIDNEIDATRRTLAKIDSELKSLREEETFSHSLMNGAYQGTASAIAERVSSERDSLAWLQLPFDAQESSPTSNAEMLEWLRICRSYSKDEISDSHLQIADTAELPNPEEFSNAVAAERDARAAVQALGELTSHRAYRSILALDGAARTNVADALRKLKERRLNLHRLGYPWLADAIRDVLQGRPASWQTLLERSQSLITRSYDLALDLGSSTVSILTDKAHAAIRDDASAVIDHLRAGGKWKSFGLLTPSAVKHRLYLLDQITVDGQPAASVDRLIKLRNYLDVTSTVRNLENMWVDYGGLPTSSQIDIRLAAIKEQVDTLAQVISYCRACLDLESALIGYLPNMPVPDWLTDETGTWLELLNAATLEERSQSAEAQATSSLRLLESKRDLHDSHPVVHTLMRAIECRDITAYSKAYSKARRIEQVRRDQVTRNRVELALSLVSGFTDAVVATVNDAAWDSRFSSWQRAWSWAIADNWLRKRIDFEYQQQLWARRKDLETTISQLLAEAAAHRAWTHFFNRLSAREAASLKSWREAVRAMGKGTGRSAKMARLRREARTYMDQCREAIPVWIMPRYLVAEMVQPAPDRYDVVIVDEASQLGIESLFLFYISKRMVVVGDDQQISPYGVGIPDQAIADLQHHFLDGIPHHHALSAQSSLYGNAKIRFGQNIVLREHFRCMPEIIQFSNDLCYASNGTPLDPLRAYPANRLKPLVLRHVSDGYRSGSSQNAVNEPEADAILAQIVACIEDPRYAGRTMGVISLQGEAQARVIEHKLLERLEPEVIEERRITCGDAYAFQGDERHIIFLSMVAAPNERIGVLSSDSARQRFNVAASRAQDQLWLFHSATLDELSLHCMRHRLLSYMLHPDRKPVEEDTQRFDSQFERDVFQKVTEKGFHVRTQVSVGDPTNHRYRIDLVVEGMQGRLAVECDGDQWHGADRYEEDMARQRDLERAGWQFVRIRGGDFYRHQDSALKPLWRELDRLGIRPGGIDEAAAEPPSPSQAFYSGPLEVDEIIDAEMSDDDVTEDCAPTYLTEDRTLTHGALDQLVQSNATAPSTIPQRSGHSLERTQSAQVKYTSYDRVAGDDPRTVHSGVVAEGLCRIIEVEGPMLAKRAYDVYLRGCGIKRMGRELKSAMNKALANAIRQGRVLSEDELGKGGFLFSIVRSKDHPPLKVRERGPRRFDEIPPSELQAIGRLLSESQGMEPGTDAHLRAILESYDLKRLTTQVGTGLLEILEKQFPYVDEWLSDREKPK